MLHQACDVTSPLIQMREYCPDGAVDRIGHIRTQLDALQQELQSPRRGAASLGQVRAYLTARASARRAFGDAMFSDPAWDMLVQLYAHDLAQSRISLSALYIVARVPAATGQRWIRQLEHSGDVERAADPLDARKHRIQLTSSGRDKMEAYFRALG